MQLRRAGAELGGGVEIDVAVAAVGDSGTAVRRVPLLQLRGAMGDLAARRSRQGGDAGELHQGREPRSLGLDVQVEADEAAFERAARMGLGRLDEALIERE